MTKTQNKQIGPQTIDKSPECLGHWTLGFEYCLEFEYWDLVFWVYDGCIELLQSCWVIINFAVSLSSSQRGLSNTAIGIKVIPLYTLPPDHLSFVFSTLK